MAAQTWGPSALWLHLQSGPGQVLGSTCHPAHAGGEVSGRAHAEAGWGRGAGAAGALTALWPPRRTWPRSSAPSSGRRRRPWLRRRRIPGLRARPAPAASARAAARCRGSGRAPAWPRRALHVPHPAPRPGPGSRSARRYVRGGAFSMTSASPGLWSPGRQDPGGRTTNTPGYGGARRRRGLPGAQGPGGRQPRLRAVPEPGSGSPCPAQTPIPRSETRSKGGVQSHCASSSPPFCTKAPPTLALFTDGGQQVGASQVLGASCVSR